MKKAEPEPLRPRKVANTAFHKLPVQLPYYYYYHYALIGAGKSVRSIKNFSGTSICDLVGGNNVMENEVLLRMILDNKTEWEQWRKDNPQIMPVLRYADLSNADLKGSILFDADLTGANLSKAKLDGANLSNADLSNADLTGASFSGALLKDVDIIVSGANLRRAILTDALLSGANLRGADLRNADMRGAVLAGADLTNADLTQANLCGSILSDANLVGANLTDAALTGTDFSRARFGNTTLGSNDLSRVKGLISTTHEQASIIGIATIYRSRGVIPEKFLLSAGVPKTFVSFLPLLVSTYLTGTIPTDQILTPRFLSRSVGPYLNAVADLQYSINLVLRKSRNDVSIKLIKQTSPITVNLDGAAEAVQQIKETISPWRRKHAEKMAQLLEQEKRAEIGSRKAEILEKRARAVKDQAEAEKIYADAALQREETERIKLENDKLRLDLHRAKIDLALNLISSIAPNLTESEKISYIVMLLPPLDQLVMSQIEMIVGEHASSNNS